tara:strand:+ start:145 stop:660 length:516 start_codon:yes stop_codon:yes gene_type:complete
MSYLLDSAVQKRLDVSLSVFEGASSDAMTAGSVVYFASADTSNSHNAVSYTLGTSGGTYTMQLDNGYTYRLKSSLCYLKNSSTLAGFTTYQWYNGSTAIGSTGMITDAITDNLGESGGGTYEENALATFNLSGSGTTDIALKIIANTNNTTVEAPATPNYYVQARLEIWRY